MSRSTVTLVRARLAHLSKDGLEYADALHDAALGRGDFQDLEPKDRAPFLKAALGVLGVPLEAPRAVAILDASDGGKRLDPALVSALRLELATITVEATRALPAGGGDDG